MLVIHYPNIIRPRLAPFTPASTHPLLWTPPHNSDPRPYTTTSLPPPLITPLLHSESSPWHCTILYSYFSDKSYHGAYTPRIPILYLALYALLDTPSTDKYANSRLHQTLTHPAPNPTSPCDRNHTTRVDAPRTLAVSGINPESDDNGARLGRSAQANIPLGPGTTKPLHPTRTH